MDKNNNSFLGGIYSELIKMHKNKFSGFFGIPETTSAKKKLSDRRDAWSNKVYDNLNNGHNSLFCSKVLRTLRDAYGRFRTL